MQRPYRALPGLHAGPPRDGACGGGNQQHCAKKSHIVRIVNGKAETRLNKEKIKEAHPCHGGRHTVPRPGGEDGNTQHTQHVQARNAAIGHAQREHEQACDAAHGHDCSSGAPLPPGAGGCAPQGPERRKQRPGMFGCSAHRHDIGDDVGFHLRREFGKALHQRFVFAEQPPASRGAPHHNFAHPAHARVFRYLGGNVLAVQGHDNRAQIFRQFQVAAQGIAAFGFIAARHGVLHKKRGEISAKGLHHAGGGADNPRIAGRA